MAFELISADINPLIERRILHDVTIERRMYSHSQARVVIDWDEDLLEGDKKSKGLHPTATLGASMLNAQLEIHWRGDDLTPDFVCFQGYVTHVSAQHHATHSSIVLDCISLSKQADLIPKYRVWQACTLLDVCQHIAGKEPIFLIQSDAESVLGGISLDLSVQYEETDFAYLSRMLHAWGIPMFVDDRAGKVGIGGPKISGNGAFPAINWHCDSVSLEGSLTPLDDKSRNAGSGASGTAKQRTGTFNSSLKRDGSGYLPRLDDDHLEEREWILDRVMETAFQTHCALYRIQWSGQLFDYSPGIGVMFAEQAFLIRAVRIASDHTSTAVTQEFLLQDYMAPMQLHPRRVAWPSRMLWARVTKNNDEDPTRQGRMQVEFDWEKLDPTGGSDRCWLPTMTPYGGLKGTTGTSGFLSLPEVGERVLVQFLGEWDSDAVILGSVREYARDGFIYDPDQTKRWRTPTGNQVSLTTKTDGSDIVQIKCQDQLIFEGVISNGKQVVIMDLFDSTTERVHFQKGGGPTRLDIFCSGEIYMHADQKLLLEGGMVQIKSTTGNVNIDGAPMVMINCGPWSLQPLTLDKDSGQESPAKTAKKRAKPPTWSAMVPASASSAATDAAAKKEDLHFIEFVLKEKETGEPIPNERYRVKLPDGSIREGSTDANGRLRVDGIPAGQCQISYPDLDADTWEPI